MEILLSNDDGIHAEGIKHLQYAARKFGDTVVVAPSEENSAVGHAITVFDPIKIHEVDHNGAFYGWAVHGTPADSVKLAVGQLMSSPPDLILSGINLGNNTGISILYSGTVSAATEGAILGIPSIAFSLCSYHDPRWDAATEAASRVLDSLDLTALAPGTLLNVNIPNLPISEIRGVRWVKVAHSRWVEEFEERTSPKGARYFWLGGVMKTLDDQSDHDVRAVEDGYISITPLHVDLTHYPSLEKADQRHQDW
jgi:5'-nucleotidase